jgi:hypothetical protein
MGPGYGHWGPQPPMPPQGSGGGGPLLAILLIAAFVLVLGTGGVIIWALWPSDSDSPVVTAGSSAGTATSTPTVSAVPAGTVPEPFGGTWKGKLTTSSGSWSVSVTLAEGTTFGTTQYYSAGSPKCSGTLRALESSDDLVTLRESTPNCDESTSGYVTLSRAGGQILYKWYSTREKMDSGRQGYSGTLVRQ